MSKIQENKTVLVTGGSRGIGEAIVRILFDKGYNVVLNYNHSDINALKIISELNLKERRMIAVKADVSDGNQVRDMFCQSCMEFGMIDILINNAGIAQQKLFVDICEEEWDRMFDVNVKGMYNCIKAVLPQMINKKEGKIINISSIWGIVGASCEVHYSATKAAVIGLTKSLAKELGPSNIQVNCVAPGVIDTDMLSDFNDNDKNDIKNQTALGVIGLPNDIANTVCFLVSENSNFITGQVISPNGGLVI